MQQVKGSLFTLIVKTIKANKSGAYNDLLTDRDREIISQKILPSVWYPFDVYKSCFKALVKVEAKGRMEIIRKASRREGGTIMTSIYKSAIIEGNPKRSLEAFVRFFKLMFDFGRMDVNELSDNHFIVHYLDFDPDFIAFYFAARGWTEKFIELVIGEDKNVDSELLEKSWEGADKTIIKYTWSS